MGASPGPFVATTALEEFWDVSGPVVFLGENCLRYSRRSVWEKLPREVLPCPWRDDAALVGAFERVRDLNERLLPPLAERLNALHGARGSVRHWRILLGPWLMLHTSLLYDRYAWAKAALARHPGMTTLLLDPSCFVVPQDTFDYALHARGDFYNLQLFTKVFGFLGREFPRKAWGPPRNVRPRAPSSGGRGFTSLVKSVLNLAAGRAKGLLMEDPPFPPRVALDFARRSWGRILPRYSGGYEDHSWSPDPGLRARLSGLPLGEGEFEALLSALLPGELPAAFVEGFADLGSAAARRFPGAPKAVMSTNSWYYDEAFKRWAAERADAGTRLLGCQHGGNYGSLVFNPSEDHEVAITDRYYTWGWARPGQPKLVPMPAPLLAGVAPIGPDNTKSSVLLLTTSSSRYVQALSLTAERTRGYLESQLRFAGALGERERAALVHRPHFVDYGWDTADRWRDRCPEVPIQGWDVPFLQALGDCRLFVCDHLSTTYAQALALDKPCVFFWDPASVEYRLRPEARDAQDLLRAAGILHDTPEGAAAEVGRAYGDVEAWWREPARQEARRRFCSRFARTSDDSVRRWAEALDSAAGGVDVEVV